MEIGGICITADMGNYWRGAWRHFNRDKAFTTFSVFGLALGLTVCLFIALFVRDELAYDRYNVNADRIFRIAADLHINGGSVNDVSTPAAMARTLVRDFPGIRNAVRIRNTRRDVAVHVGKEVFMQSGVVLADSTLFAVFTLPLLSGDPQTALVAPNSVVLSETAARRYFNSVDVVGQTLKLDEDSVVCRVTGVIQDMPEASHFHFQLIRSMQQRREEWVNFYSATYVLAQPGVGVKDIDRMLAQVVDKYVYRQVREQLHNSESDLRAHGDYFRYYSIPLTRIHLQSHLGGEFEVNGNAQYVILFTVVAILILGMAGVNFVNLSIARSFRRMREIGVRKVLGSNRWKLAGQFLVESVLITALALGMAVVLVLLLLPFFDGLTGKSFTVSIVLSRWVVPIFVAAAVLVGLGSGAYPAIVLSGVDALKILRGQLGMGGKAGTLRRALLVFQFSVAMLLMIGTGVIYSQLSYVRHRDLGYTRQQVLTVKNTGGLGDTVWTFGKEAGKLPGVVDVTVSSSLPNQKVVLRGFFKDQSQSVTSTMLLGDWKVDAEYVSTLDMKLVAGRNFSPVLSTDSGAVLINETAERALGYARPVGEKIYTAGSEVFRIIGVVKDFNTGSMRSPIDAVVLRLAKDGGAVSFRLSAENMERTIKLIQLEYERFAKGQPFVYSFLDEDFNRLYAADEQMGILFTVFSVLAIIIAGLGMFGLVTAAAEQRTKELGIRRVLGARTVHLAGLLLKEYGSVIIVSVLIAVPVGAWAMSSWLEGYAYRVGLPVWVFVASPLGALALAVVIVGVKAGRTAAASLSETLRVE